MTTATAPKRGLRLGHDDFALNRVPQDRRYGFLSMLLQWLAQSGSLSQFVLGATIGAGMTFGHAFAAFSLGAVVLEVVIFAVGLAGQREGLSMTLLTRFTGFGRNGSALVSLVIAISLVGWFGIQNAIFADSLSSLVGGPPWIWSVIGGVVLTALVIYGFRYMMWLARIAVPLFFGLIAWSVISILTHHDLGRLVHSAPTGAALSIPAAATIIAGGYMTGAVVAPDMTRFNRRGWHLVVQSSCSMILSEYIVGMTGVLLGHAVGTDNVSKIVLDTAGGAGLIIVILATAKINDWNLYSSSLGIVNFVQTVLGKRLHRASVTLVVGTLGTVLAAIGFLQHFTSFLSLLGVAIPPVGGIIVAEYWIVRSQRDRLDETRAQGRLPESTATWYPVTLLVWALAFCIGKFVPVGIPVLNSLLTALILYSILGRLDLVRPSELVPTAEQPLPGELSSAHN